MLPVLILLTDEARDDGVRAQDEVGVKARDEVVVKARDEVGAKAKRLAERGGGCKNNDLSTLFIALLLLAVSTFEVW